MKSIESMFRICFDDIAIIDDRAEDYSFDSIAKFESNNADHFWDDLITDSKNVHFKFVEKKTGKTESRHDQVASTMTVDEYENEFVALVRKSVGSVITLYDKKSPVYKEFFLKPLKYYTEPRRSLISTHIDHFITRFTAHNELPGDLKIKFTALKAAFDPARSTQVHKIATVSTLVVDTSAERQALNVRLFRNVIAVVDRYPGKPEYAAVYFDQSKLFHHAKVKDDEVVEEDFSVSMKEMETKNTGLVNIIGKTARFVSLRGGKVQIYTVASLDNLEPGSESVTLDEDGDITAKMEQLGDDTNPYLIVRNLENIEAEVIIEWVD
jgi:hypothetical protein